MRELGARGWALVLAFALVHLSIPLARVDAGRAFPFSGRFSWSMFAGPLTAHCTHELAMTDREGRTSEPPLPPPSDAVGRVLRARSPLEFATTAAPRLYAYADDDPTLARALDDLLRRWWSTRPERGRHTLVSTLRCATPRQRPFERTLRLEPPR